MKKRLLILAVVFVALLISLFLIFPANQKVEGTYAVGSVLPATLRLLQNQQSWERWLPNQPSTDGTKQLKQKFALAGNPEDRIVLYWTDQRDTVPVLFSMTSIGTDSTLIVYTAEMNTRQNPLKRIALFATGQRLSNDLKTFLTSFGLFAGDARQVYGFEPQYTRVTDTLLITTRSTFAQKPGTPELYQLIEKLNQYVVGQRAEVTGNPMYQVVEKAGTWEMQVALPVNRLLPDKGPVVAKRMVDGNLLIAEVQAGPQRLQSLYANFELFRNEHQLGSPAIPFLQPITDRMKEPDTLKWVTRMCYPIF